MNASLLFPIGHPIDRWMPSFPCRGIAYAISVQAMTCSLFSLWLSHCFLARVETIVLLPLEEKSKEYLS